MQAMITRIIIPCDTTVSSISWGSGCDHLQKVYWINNLYVETFWKKKYPQMSNISHILVGNLIVDQSDVVGALPVGAAATTSSFST